ncbi:MAG: hypothetical protein IPP91_17270 [Betaproteobacteria bacterium]|nr:hypothetical protein [Betaproteobacteria bacterium]
MKENQPKHRQLAKERSKSERKIALRRENGTALLVCEGKCTEPFYLQGLLQSPMATPNSRTCGRVKLPHLSRRRDAAKLPG